ncbi:unnamed protein product [Closterium sp. NIES-54]
MESCGSFLPCSLSFLGLCALESFILCTFVPSPLLPCSLATSAHRSDDGRLARKLLGCGAAFLAACGAGLAASGELMGLLGALRGFVVRTWHCTRDENVMEGLVLSARMLVRLTAGGQLCDGDDVGGGEAPLAAARGGRGSSEEQSEVQREVLSLVVKELSRSSAAAGGAAGAAASASLLPGWVGVGGWVGHFPPCASHCFPCTACLSSTPPTLPPPPLSPTNPFWSLQSGQRHYQPGPAASPVLSVPLSPCPLFPLTLPFSLPLPLPLSPPPPSPPSPSLSLSPPPQPSTPVNRPNPLQSRRAGCDRSVQVITACIILRGTIPLAHHGPRRLAPLPGAITSPPLLPNNPPSPAIILSILPSLPPSPTFFWCHTFTFSQSPFLSPAYSLLALLFSSP